MKIWEKDIFFIKIKGIKYNLVNIWNIISEIKKKKKTLFMHKYRMILKPVSTRDLKSVGCVCVCVCVCVYIYTYTFSYNFINCQTFHSFNFHVFFDFSSFTIFSIFHFPNFLFFLFFKFIIIYLTFEFEFYFAK